MLLSDDEVEERMESPFNLINRLRDSLDKATNPFIIPTSTQTPAQIPSLPPSSTDLIDDLDAKISNSAARMKASNIMLLAMDELKDRISTVSDPTKLSHIAERMSVIVSRVEPRVTSSESHGSQIIIYAPRIQSIDNYEIIDVKE